MAVTNGWGQAAANNTNGYGKYENTIDAGSIYADSWAGDTDLIGVSADFSYPASSYAQDGSNPTPTITGTTGGTFSASPAGLTLNTSTGEITLSSSTIASYTITYTVSGVSSSVPMAITAASFINDYSMSFDGVNDIISLGDPSIIGNKSELSFSMWFNTNHATNMQGLLGAYPAATGSLQKWFAIQIDLNDSYTIRVTLANATGNYRYVDFNPTLSTSTWYHLVVVYDGSGATDTDKIKAYLDGAVLTSNNQLSPIPTTTYAYTSSDWPLWIGSRGYNTNPPTANLFDGKIDEVAIWDSILGATAVTQIYNSGTPIALDSDKGNYTSSANLISWYRMGDN